MTSNYYGGYHVTQHGDHNIGMQHGNNVGTVNGVPLTDAQRAALAEVIDAARVLRRQVRTSDGQQIDESLKVIEAGGNVRSHTLRQAMTSLAGVATVVGQVGAPVIDAVRKVMDAFAS